MNIPEVKDLEMVALSKDRIRVGDAYLDRAKVVSLLECCPWTKRRSDVFWYAGDPYWLTSADCYRALKLMDEYLGPQPKFKVGD